MAWIRRLRCSMFLLSFFKLLLSVASSAKRKSPLTLELQCVIFSLYLIVGWQITVWNYTMQQGLGVLLCENIAQAGRNNLLTLLPSLHLNTSGIIIMHLSLMTQFLYQHRSSHREIVAKRLHDHWYLEISEFHSWSQMQLWSGCIYVVCVYNGWFFNISYSYFWFFFTKSF